MEWFEKLKQAKEMIDSVREQGADYLRIAADFFKKTSESLNDAANSFDPTPSVPQPMLGAVNTEQVESFLKECERDCNHPRVGANTDPKGVFWEQALLTVLVEVTKRILDRRKNKN